LAKRRSQHGKGRHFSKENPMIDEDDKKKDD
jgi:hypothetical protein